MIVFKTFLKVLNKCKVPILMYSAFLVFFSVFNMTANETTTSFEKERPDLAIVNEDVNEGITASLIDYLKANSEEASYESEGEIDDALFYRDVNYVIYIPKGFREDFLAGKNPDVRIKSTGDYMASLAEMMLERYLNVANVYLDKMDSERELVEAIEKTLNEKVDVVMTTSLDTGNLEKAATYYNFMNYCLLAGAIYIICLILSTFKEERIDKRTIVSSMNYKSFNRKLIFYNGLFTFILWLVYVLISVLIIGEVMFTIHGAMLILNSFVFSLCCLSLAFLIGNVLHNKEAINGIVNVIALGSSFLCGSFVPMEWLPRSVLNIAHVLPSYWYIKTNELVKTMEVIDWETSKVLFGNMIVILCFAISFTVIMNVTVSKKRRRA